MDELRATLRTRLKLKTDRNVYFIEDALPEAALVSEAER